MECYQLFWNAVNHSMYSYTKTQRVSILSSILHLSVLIIIILFFFPTQQSSLQSYRNYRVLAKEFLAKVATNSVEPQQHGNMPEQWLYKQILISSWILLFGAREKQFPATVYGGVAVWWVEKSKSRRELFKCVEMTLPCHHHQRPALHLIWPAEMSQMILLSPR